MLSLKRSSLRLAALLLPLLWLGGCVEDVRPLYGSTVLGGGDISAKLQTIVVDEVSGRLGHYLGDDLQMGLNGSGAPVQPEYHLVITLHEGTETPLIDTVTGIATSATVVTTADFKLVPVGKGLVFKGTAYVAASYDRTTNRFSNVRAARDAEIRDARTLADQIQTQISAELATRS